MRPIKEDELPQLLSLYTHLHDKDDPSPTPETLAATWDLFINSERDVCFGEFVEDTLVSSLVLSVIPNLTRGCRPYGVIENVVTHTEFRRKGYGQKMLRETLAFAWQKNCYKVMLLTGRLDEATFSFYESAGFDRHLKQAFIAR